MNGTTGRRILSFNGCWSHDGLESRVCGKRPRECRFEGEERDGEEFGCQKVFGLSETLNSSCQRLQNLQFLPRIGGAWGGLNFFYSCLYGLALWLPGV